ncbi:MAG: transcriptional regulator [Geminicoccaceae bacterium]|jgi:putative transcriptional regulator|nr:MAG: transcriptional regulator [Geminicoccaceae bacterium]
MNTERDLGAELLEAVRAIKRGEGRRYEVATPGDVKAIRDRLGLGQSAFAALVGVSVRTLQDWERGRRMPRGPALALLRVVARHPEVFAR